MKKIEISNVTWVICGLIILFGLSATWFFTYFDKEQFTRTHGYSDEAIRNRFLAAQLFLEKQDVEFEKRENYQLFDEKLGRNDTIIINSSRVGMSQATLEKMKAWLNNGGNLVLLATETFDYDFESSRDEFLDSLGLRFYSNGYQNYNDDEDSETEDDSVEFQFPEFEETTKVEFYGSGYIEDTSGNATFVAGNQYADQFIQYHYGDGLVSVISDFSIWNNYRIDQHDHAMFLRQIIGESAKTWLLYNRNQPSLISMAVLHAPLVVISSMVLLVFLLWSGLWRVGAKKSDELAVNREIMQHLAASAEFNYRLDEGQRLIKSLLESIHHRMAQLSHGYGRLTPPHQLEKIAIHTGLDKKQLSILLNTTNESEETFLDKVKLIQKIRTHL